MTSCAAADIPSPIHASFIDHRSLAISPAKLTVIIFPRCHSRYNVGSLFAILASRLSVRIIHQINRWRKKNNNKRRKKLNSKIGENYELILSPESSYMLLARVRQHVNAPPVYSKMQFSYLHTYYESVERGWNGTETHISACVRAIRCCW